MRLILVLLNGGGEVIGSVVDSHDVQVLPQIVIRTASDRQTSVSVDKLALQTLVQSVAVLGCDRVAPEKVLPEAPLVSRRHVLHLLAHLNRLRLLTLVPVVVTNVNLVAS